MSSTEPTPDADARPLGKIPGWMHAGIMVVLLLIFLAFTFTPPSSAPPSIAEVAPQAVARITQAPIQQAVSSGGSKGHAGSGTTGPSPKPSPSPTPTSPKTIERPSPYRCIGNPPRQIEDPQSPPCVPFWQGDNGGSTYQGVTGDTISVAVPDYADGDPLLKAYQDFFNRRFQFYGRKLVLQGIAADYSPTPDPATSQQNLAAKVDQEYHAFASTTLDSYQGTVYYQELARRKVLAVSNNPVYSQSQLGQLAPYVWQYPMALDTTMATTADWLCHRLVNATADYTTDPTLFKKPRRFGLLWEATEDQRFDLTPIVDGLKACRGSFVVTKQLPFNDESKTGNNTGAQYEQDPTVQAAVTQLKQQGVTTVVCLCPVFVLGPVGVVASQQNYQPEWVVTSYMQNELLFAQLTNNNSQNQRQGMFGISSIPRLVRAANDPSVWAIQEENPSLFNVSRDSSQYRQLIFQKLYRSLLLLASGIQMAGPHLTPETFAAGLHDAVFPNPYVPAIQAGTVGFAGGSYSMTRDVAEFYWSNAALPPYTADTNGTWCYVDGGARRRAGSWPGQPAFFAANCDSGR